MKFLSVKFFFLFVAFMAVFASADTAAENPEGTSGAAGDTTMAPGGTGSGAQAAGQGNAATKGGAAKH